MPVINKVSRGDMIAVRVLGSYHTISMQRVGTEEWILAEVNTVARDGSCRTFVKRSGSVEKVGRLTQVFTLSADRQADARRLLKSLSCSVASWTNGEALKQALREADTREAA